MVKPLRLIRGTSIEGILFMNTAQKANLKERIFENDGITTAKANQAHRVAGRENSLIRRGLNRVESLNRRYNAGVQAIENIICSERSPA